MRAIGKGVFEVQLSAGTVGFKFGMYASSITQEVAGKKIQQMFVDMYEPVIDESGKIVASRETAYTQIGLVNYFYGGAVAYAIEANKPKPTIVAVGDWIEEMGVDKAVEIYTESIKSPNAETPTKKHQSGSVSE